MVKNTLLIKYVSTCTNQRQKFLLHGFFKTNCIHLYIYIYAELAAASHFITNFPRCFPCFCCCFYQEIDYTRHFSRKFGVIKLIRKCVKEDKICDTVLYDFLGLPVTSIAVYFQGMLEVFYTTKTSFGYILSESRDMSFFFLAFWGSPF